MKKYFLLILSVFLFIASCKKKEFPKNISEDPTFYLNATIDGNPLSIKAGMLGYYMFSSYTQDTNNLYSFIAEVKPRNCAGTCTNSLKFEINDNQLSTPNGASNISNSIKTGDYSFAYPSIFTPSLVAYSVQFKSSFNKPNPTYDWNFGDGSPHSTLADPVHTYTYAAIYNTSLSIHDGQMATSITNPIKVTISPAAVQTRIFVDAIIGNKVTFRQYTTGGSGNYLYQWKFGDPANSSSIDPIGTFTYQNPGLYLATLKVKDYNNSDSTFFSYYVNTDLSSKSAPNFSVASITPIYSNVLNTFSKVKITYTDNNGVTYISNLQQQTSSTSNFKIVSVEDFMTNENNQATKKIKVSFHCKLYNGSSSVDLQNGEAVLAISYK